MEAPLALNGFLGPSVRNPVGALRSCIVFESQPSSEGLAEFEQEVELNILAAPHHLSTTFLDKMLCYSFLLSRLLNLIFFYVLA